MVRETSPRTRGEPTAAYGISSVLGNIPAHTRGEQPSSGAPRMPPETSPHTRGEQKSRLKKPRSSRNIPAYAGRTASKRIQVDRFEKHPRIRGENLPLCQISRRGEETSPHTRGELLTFPCTHNQCAKHPRIRGENWSFGKCGQEKRETSPHTRGEREAASKSRKTFGNIPAYAGRTEYAEGVERTRWKHPRIRGENAALYWRQYDVGGNIPAYAGRTLRA